MGTQNTYRHVGKITWGHNVDVMKNLNDDSIDLTVTSPPYDDLRLYHGFQFDFEGVAEQIYRVTKPNGVVVWVVGDAVINNSESGTSFKQALHFMSLGFKLHDTMIYEKATSTFPSRPTDNRYTQVFEYMFVLSKDGQPKTANLICDKKNITGGMKSTGQWVSRHDDSIAKVGSVFVTAKYSARLNIWRYSVGGCKLGGLVSQQPAIFPDLLARDHIISWSNPGDLVLDPFSGSGTTCLMAAETKRRFIGIEICEEYCKIARKRLTYDADIEAKAREISSNDFEDLLV